MSEIMLVVWDRVRDERYLVPEWASDGYDHANMVGRETATELAMRFPELF